MAKLIIQPPVVKIPPSLVPKSSDRAESTPDSEPLRRGREMECKALAFLANALAQAAACQTEPWPEDTESQVAA